MPHVLSGKHCLSKTNSLESVFKKVKIDSSLIQHILATFLLLYSSLPLPLLTSPLDPLPLFPLQKKKKGLQENTARQARLRRNKVRQNGMTKLPMTLHLLLCLLIFACFIYIYFLQLRRLHFLSLLQVPFTLEQVISLPSQNRTDSGQD